MRVPQCNRSSTQWICLVETCQWLFLKMSHISLDVFNLNPWQRLIGFGAVRWPATMSFACPCIYSHTSKCSCSLTAGQHEGNPWHSKTPGNIPSIVCTWTCTWASGSRKPTKVTCGPNYKVVSCPVLCSAAWNLSLKKSITWILDCSIGAW